MLRANNYSHYPDHPLESYYGYLVAVFDGKVHLYKTYYGKRELASFTLDDSSIVNHKIVLNGSLISVYQDGKIIGIVEHLDLMLLKIKENLKKGLSLEEAYKILNLSEKQKAKLDKKASLLKPPYDDCYIEINSHKLSSSDITASGMVICATYLYKRDAINSSLSDLKSDNAQNEIYFTDTVMNIARNGLVSYVKVDDRNLIHTFNTIEELNAINESLEK